VKLLFNHAMAKIMLAAIAEQVITITQTMANDAIVRFCPRRPSGRLGAILKICNTAIFGPFYGAVF